MQAIPKTQARKIRTRVEAKAAYAASVRFYRSGGQPWTRQLA
jgi:hypothetical protein